jgi:PIN domain nuclease of toxin-antitoxin system
MRLLLDTHAFVWWAVDHPRLSPAARTALERLDSEVFVSAASAWELATKVRNGKWPDAADVAAEICQAIKDLGFRELAMTVEHGQRAGSLPGDHKDPFDRMLIAQAQAENLTLVSNERIFDDWHVPRIW